MPKNELSIAIIPARGRSKRIPQKNIIDFCGKPMIAWTIEAALQSGMFDRVLVSTDDADIAEVATQYGAAAPFLRQVASDDIAPVSVATLHALDQAETYWGEKYASVTQLMANCPLREVGEIQRAWEHFITTGANFQLSCFEYGFMNPWWAHTINDEWHPTPLFREALTQRSQDLPKLYCPTGAIWIARVDALRASGTFYGPDHRFYSISWQAALDIDTEDDLLLASAVFSTQGREMGLTVRQASE